jgi:MFS family permease
MKMEWRSPFWLGSILATTGVYISITASLLNLYRFNQSAQPILIMMFIEALVPLLSLPLLAVLFEKLQYKTLFFLAAFFGVTGALIQTLDISSLFVQFSGILLASIAASIFKPMMMQVASIFSTEPEERLKLNKMVTFVNYFGLLCGYIISGVIIERFGYVACFIVNACTYFAFALLLFFVKIRNHKVDVTEDDTKFSTSKFLNILKANPGVISVYIMTIALWLTGGSINVLEIPFAKKVMSASDSMVTLLFFASATGSIVFSLIKIDMTSKIFSLPSLTLFSGATIALYVGIADFSLSLLFLFFFGLAVGAHSVVSMSMLQNSLKDAELSQGAIVLNTLNQTVGLLAAAMGVFLSTAYEERMVCLAFAAITVLVSMAYVRPLYQKVSP